MKWNTDLIETMELEHVMSQAAQYRIEGDKLHDIENLKLTNVDDVQWTKHASRSDSQGQQRDLTSRGGVLVERVCEERPHDMSTNTTQPQGLALCSRCHLAWASEAPHTTRGRGWPDTNDTNVKSRCNDASSKHSKNQSSDKHETNMVPEGDHQ